jgi:hypothetical protein
MKISLEVIVSKFKEGVNVKTGVSDNKIATVNISLKQ